MGQCRPLDADVTIMCILLLSDFSTPFSIVGTFLLTATVKSL